jgi:hypothetical protein
VHCGHYTSDFSLLKADALWCENSGVRDRTHVRPVDRKASVLRTYHYIAPQMITTFSAVQRLRSCMVGLQWGSMFGDWRPVERDKRCERSPTARVGLAARGSPHNNDSCLYSWSIPFSVDRASLTCKVTENQWDIPIRKAGSNRLKKIGRSGHECFLKCRKTPSVHDGRAVSGNTLTFNAENPGSTSGLGDR